VYGGLRAAALDHSEVGSEPAEMLGDGASESPAGAGDQDRAVAQRPIAGPLRQASTA